MTTAWITVLLLSWTGSGACTEVTILQEPTPLPSFVQPLGLRVADVHTQTVSVARVDGISYDVLVQETTRYHGDDPGTSVTQVFVNGLRVPGVPHFDAAPRPAPLWCSLPTGTPYTP